MERHSSPQVTQQRLTTDKELPPPPPETDTSRDGEKKESFVKKFFRHKGSSRGDEPNSAGEESKKLKISAPIDPRKLVADPNTNTSEWRSMNCGDSLDITSPSTQHTTRQTEQTTEQTTALPKNPSAKSKSTLPRSTSAFSIGSSLNAMSNSLGNVFKFGSHKNTTTSQRDRNELNETEDEELASGVTSLGQTIVPHQTSTSDRNKHAKRGIGTAQSNTNDTEHDRNAREGIKKSPILQRFFQENKVFHRMRNRRKSQPGCPVYDADDAENESSKLLNRSMQDFRESPHKAGYAPDHRNAQSEIDVNRPSRWSDTTPSEENGDPSHDATHVTNNSELRGQYQLSRPRLWSASSSEKDEMQWAGNLVPTSHEVADAVNDNGMHVEADVNNHEEVVDALALQRRLESKYDLHQVSQEAEDAANNRGLNVETDVNRRKLGTQASTSQENLQTQSPRTRPFSLISDDGHLQSAEVHTFQFGRPSLINIPPASSSTTQSQRPDSNQLAPLSSSYFHAMAQNYPVDSKENENIPSPTLRPEVTSPSQVTASAKSTDAATKGQPVVESKFDESISGLQQHPDVMGFTEPPWWYKAGYSREPSPAPEDESPIHAEVTRRLHADGPEKRQSVFIPSSYPLPKHFRSITNSALPTIKATGSMSEPALPSISAACVSGASESQFTHADWAGKPESKFEKANVNSGNNTGDENHNKAGNRGDTDNDDGAFQVGAKRTTVLDNIHGSQNDGSEPTAPGASVGVSFGHGSGQIRHSMDTYPLGSRDTQQYLPTIKVHDESRLTRLPPRRHESRPPSSMESAGELYAPFRNFSMRWPARNRLFPNRTRGGSPPTMVPHNTPTLLPSPEFTTEQETTPQKEPSEEPGEKPMEEPNEDEIGRAM